MTLSPIPQIQPAIRRDRMVRLTEVKRLTGCKKSTIYKLISEGSFPKPVHIGTRTVAWSENAVLQWVQDRINGVEPPTPHAAAIQGILEKYGDAKEICAGLEIAAHRLKSIGLAHEEQVFYYLEEAAIHMRGLDSELRDLSKGGRP